MKAEEMSPRYLTLGPNGVIAEIELNREIAAALARLPDDPSLYFDLGEPHVMIPLGQLVNARARDRGIINANRHMLAAAKGNEKRKPLTVRPPGKRIVAGDGWQFDFAQRASFEMADDTLLHRMTGHMSMSPAAN